MSSLILTLSMLTNQDRGHAPGWYVSAHSSDNGILIEPAMVPEPAARIIGNAFNVVVNTYEVSAKLLPEELVTIGETQIREALIQELAFAEEQAKKIAGLRKRLQELKGGQGQESETSM